MKYKLLSACIFIAVIFNNTYAQRNQPKNKKAIICLTYDDGLPSQLTTVLNQLNAFNFKGTFFLNTISGSSTVIGEASPSLTGWTTAAKQGHELANHTLFHPCPEKLGWQKAFAIESYTVDKMINEIKLSNNLLSLLDPAGKTRAFAYPCNNFLVGNTDYSSIIKSRHLVSYGRAGGDKTSIITNFKVLNTMKVPSWMVEEGTSLTELIAFAERVKQGKGMGVFQFHGVGAEFFKISSEVHQAFLSYLKAHEADYWVTTFSGAMNFVTK